MKRVKIWCDITCSHCGVIADNSGYYSPARIKALKQETKKWENDETRGILCPHCAKELKENGEIF